LKIYVCDNKVCGIENTITLMRIKKSPYSENMKARTRQKKFLEVKNGLLDKD
jgi:hypothetical protein